MLDLSGSTRTVAGLTLAPDSDGPECWLVLPGAPRPAAGPDVQLLRFVRDGALTGGYLRLGVDLGVPDAAIEAATAALVEENAGKPVTLSPLLVVAAEADLLFYGRDATDAGTPSPVVLRRYGTSLLEANAPHRGVFAVSLTAEGVRLVESGLHSGELPIGVTCRLTAEGLWPTVQVTARVNWSSVYDHFSTDYRLGALLFSEDVSQLMQRLVQEGAVGVTVVQSVAPGADPASTSAAVAVALDFVQTDLLDQFCKPVLPLRTDAAQASLGAAGDVLNLGAAYEVKALTEIETATGFYDFSQASVVRRVITTQASLGDLLGGADPSGLVGDAGVDDPFFKQFHIDCHTVSPLTDSHLDDAVLDVAYGTASGSVRLTTALPTGGFDAYADASPNGAWTVTPRVTLSADSPVDPGTVVTLPALTGSSRDLILDLDDALGLVRLDVEGSPDPRVLATALTVTEASGGADRTTRPLSLTPTAPTGSVWFRDHRAGDTLTVSGRHLLADGRQVPIPPTRAETRVFRLPNPFAGSMTVQIVTDETWKDLTRVVVAIQKDVSTPVRTFAFDAPGTAAVALDLPDPTDRTYRYQVSRVVGGITQDDPWLVSDAPLVAAGRASASELVVDVEPVGLELPAAGLRLVQVDLLYVDVAHQVRAEHTHVIAAKADSYRWEVALADPSLRSYQYRITKQLLRGDSLSGGWVDSSDPILPVALTAS